MTSEHITLLLSYISKQQFADEDAVVRDLSVYINKSGYNHNEIAKKAVSYIENLRNNKTSDGAEAFFHQYGLDTEEGIAMMSLTECLLRVPDSRTANELIHDKLDNIDWKKHAGKSDSKLVNASTFGLQIAAKFFSSGQLISSVAEPIIRESIKHSIRHLGNNFVMGEDIKSALKEGHKYYDKGYLISYDMLGEAACNNEQAENYLKSYLEAIENIALAQKNDDSDINFRHGISIKLSALYPKFELLNRDEVLKHLVPKVKLIMQKAMESFIPVTIDAEEARRLDIMLEVFSHVIEDEKFAGFEGMGIAVQAYQKRAFDVISYIAELGRIYNRRIPVRLVKGAYWDSEIKQAQISGLKNYPVFTRKEHSDISYLACAYKIKENIEYIYPQFATHNILTIAAIEHIMSNKQFEFQLLHGMGEGIYKQIVNRRTCRIYAPVGIYKDLLAYLIRRLLENSANGSFVRKVADDKISVAELVRNPLEIDQSEHKYDIALPVNIYKNRISSDGYDIGNIYDLDKIIKGIEPFYEKAWCGEPVFKGFKKALEYKEVFAPYDNSKKIGKVATATIEDAGRAMEIAYGAFYEWSKTDVSQRSVLLEKFADLLEQHKFEAIALCMQEAGKTIVDSLAEVREAVDFCRYYAMQAEYLQNNMLLDSPTGESNKLTLQGRGVFVCISPWNFPLAIFVGQIAAALIMGNSVVAKPAGQTPLIAKFAVDLMLDAGIPEGVINLVPGDGADIGSYLIMHPACAGVAFTGSVVTAKAINRLIAGRDGVIIPLIAETGGQNAMIIDSTALPEQAVDDIISSAFTSAGQRCSALRILYIQDDIFYDIIDLLKGAVRELNIGLPEDISVDVASVIDDKAKTSLLAHIKQMTDNGYELLCSGVISEEVNKNGHYVAPHVILIDDIKDVQKEVFGPVLHVRRFKNNELDRIIEEINSTGYGLTFGLNSRIGSRADYMAKHIKSGNIYVNRSMIGATVGVQPFGGEGLSGTGFKAGGPNYLLRFATERTITINTTSFGGNRDLLAR